MSSFAIGAVAESLHPKPFAYIRNRSRLWKSNLGEPNRTPAANISFLSTLHTLTYYQSQHSTAEHSTLAKMALVKSLIPVALVSREDSGSKPVSDEVTGVTIALIALGIVGIIWLNVLIWKRAHRKAVEAVSAA